MAVGFSSVTFLLQAVSLYVKSVIYYNTFFFDEGSSIFTDFENTKGDQLKFPIEYSHTSNGGTYSFDDPMPESDSVSGVFAYFTKDPYQKAVRLYKLLQAFNVGRGDSIDETALGTALSNDMVFSRVIQALRAQVCSTFMSDLESQIDSSGTYSDAALSRSVYGFASYEDTTGGSVALTMLEDAVEALMSAAHGSATIDQLTWLMPINQVTNVARLQSGTVGTEVGFSMLPMVTSSQDKSGMDAGRIMRAKSYEGIPIVTVPGMTSTNILLVRNGTLRRCIWRDVETTDKTAGVPADQELYHIKFGANVFCDMPSWNGKISGLTA